MGIHAFDQHPEHCERYRAAGITVLPRLAGFGDGWNMPAVRHRSTLGDGTHFAGVDHYVMTLQFNTTSTHRIDDPEFGFEAQRGSLSLQAPGSGGTFKSNGPVEYGHLYFKQSLLCEIADQSERQDHAEVEDFFALHDEPLAREVEAYFARAHDEIDPASALEMDSRAYLIGLNLLRMRARRQGKPLALRSVSGPDLGPVLTRMEDSIRDPVRLSDLAPLLDMTTFQFARFFRSETGETPAAYLARRRVERAVELIRTTDLSFAEVAYQTGFSSQSHMNRRIKAVLGVTPGQVRDGKDPKVQGGP